MAQYKTAKDITSKYWDVIVIGSGMGGLTAAAALARQGKRCLILEQHYLPGGFTHEFQRKGFTWDVGVHAVGDLHKKGQMRRMFDYISEGRLDWEYFGDVYETFRFPDGKEFIFPSNEKDFRKAMEDYFPEDRESIRTYFQYVDQAVKELPLFYVGKTLPKWTMKSINALGLAGKKWRTVKTQEIFDQLKISERAKAVLLSQWGYYGDLPTESSFAIQAMVAKHFASGAYYPIGGSSAIAREVLKTIQAGGGDIALRSPVKGLIIESGKCVGVKATHRDGTYEFRAPVIMAATSALTLVNHLVPKEYQTTQWAQEIKGFKQSPPHVCLYLGFHGDILKSGATHSSQWVNHTWKVDQRYWNCDQPNSRPPTIFVSFPSIKDPKHDPGPEMKHTGEVVTFVDYEVFKKWEESKRGKRPEDYQAFKKDLEDRILNEFKEAFPELAKLIVYHELSTPLSTTFYVDAPEGAIYGLEHTPKRFLSTELQTRTPIPGLYLAASDAATGGVAGALMGGLLAAATIQPKVFLKMV